MKSLVLFLIALNVYVVNAQDTTKVLFIGNSITYFNNMPQTFEAIANSKGDFTDVTMYAPGGTGFVNHVNDLNVYNHFEAGDWDYIVLQPGSNESPGYSFTIDQTLGRARVLIDSIYKYNPCAEILFYEISYGIWGSAPADSVTYNNTMTLIKDNLELLSDSTESFFAPVGEAFKTRWNHDLNDILWGGFGDIHPNAKGSYIAACTFYASIFQKPSSGTNITGTLSQQEANAIQTLCDTIVLNNLTDWRINVFDQVADFTFLVNTDTVNFTNSSQNIDSVMWDFGDSQTSNLLNPSHVYDHIGSYTVVLSTFKNGCERKEVQTVIIETVSVKANDIWDKVKVYPNPFTSSVIIEHLQNNENIVLLNMLGQDVSKLTSSSNVANGIIIDASNLPRGTYVIKIAGKAKLLYKQ